MSAVFLVVAMGYLQAASGFGRAAAGGFGRAAMGGQRASCVQMADLVVDLGENYGMVGAKFEPMLEKSEFVVVRFAVPFNLNVEPKDGKIMVTKTDDSLKEGDIVRATSTFSMRMESAFGLLPAAKKTKALFDVTGKEWDQVVQAFKENRKSVTNDVVLVVERPLSDL